MVSRFKRIRGRQREIGRNGGFRLIRVDFPAIGRGRFVNKFFKMSKAGVKVVVTQRLSALCPDEIS